MPGLNRETGGSLEGWDHVVQSIQVIFTTAFHERVMLRWFGSLLPRMLGEPMNHPTILRFFYAMVLAIELWEPRFRVVHVGINEANREGKLSVKIEGVYFPNAHRSDFTTEVKRNLIVIARQTGVTITNSFETGAAA